MSVRHALLALLSEGPKYGLRLRQEFEAQTGEIWPLNVGQVYTTLHRLEKDGNVRSRRGRRHAEAVPDHPGRPSASSTGGCAPRPDVDAPPRDELVIKVQVALRMPGVDVVDLLQVHRRHVVEAMQKYTHLKAETPRARSGLGLVVDAELFRLEGIVRWLDAAAGAAATPARPVLGRDARGAAGPGAARTDRGRAAWRRPMSARWSCAGVQSVRSRSGSGTRPDATSTWTVAVGELVAVMGPSGSGKSTLLTIAGSLGRAHVRARSSIGGADVARLAAERPGPVAPAVDRFRLPGLQPARRAVGAGERGSAAGTGRLRGRAARVAAAVALDELGLADRAEHYPDDLSGGERQRVAIARAVVGDRHLLLADEPTGALDSVNGELVMRMLRSACKRGIAGVVVTHDAQLASWADRVVFIRDGRIVDQTATPDGPEVAAHQRSTP